MDLIKHFWSLIRVEQQQEMVSAYTLMSLLTQLKTILTTLVSVIFSQFSTCIILFDIAG
jgi:hypothetical protein